MTRSTDEQRREMLVEMVTARVRLQRVWKLQRQSPVGTKAPVDGYDAAVAE